MVRPVTVLLAAWNGENWLAAQLDSLRAQTYPDFRVLMQDDGSTDGTPAILADAARRDARFAAGREEGRRLGAKGNFTSLLCQTEGGWTALCDQDDVWEPDRLAGCAAAMAEAEARWGADAPLLVHSDCAVVDADLRPLFPSFFAHQGWDAAAVSLAELLVMNNVTGCTVLMNEPLRRLAAEHADPERMFMHDWFFALTAAACGHIVFVPKALVRYRQHGDNALGASRSGVAARALAALRQRDRVRERIALTYRNAEGFLACMGGSLPEEARRTVEAYLATEKLPKWRRVTAVRRGGYRMQNRAARAAQLLFG